MPTPQSNAINEAHRRAQFAVGLGAVSDLLRIWPAYDLSRIARSWPPVEEAMVRSIQVHGRTSDGVAAVYYRRYRKAAGIKSQFTPVLRDVPEEQIRAGLRFVGAVMPGQALATGRRPDDVEAATLVNLSGEAAGRVRDFGRDTVMTSARQDPAATGWSRVTGGKPCSFCAMIASRGPIFGEGSADFEAHRHCACSAQPSFGKDDWPDRSKEFRQVWDDATEGATIGVPGTARGRRLRAFRRVFEGR